MKVLWTVNTFNPSIAKQMNIKSAHPISWVEAMCSKIKNVEGVQLAIACPNISVEMGNKRIDNVEYYAVPNNEIGWEELIKDYDPDVIHGYGTEKQHNLIVANLANHRKIPLIISLQGILSEYQRHYYGGIDISEILRYTPIRDIIRPSGIITGRKDFIKRSKTEIELLHSVRFVEGRSTWDRVSALGINSKLDYYYCPRMLREEFYASKCWNLESVKRHTIFITQGNYPIKGVHFAFKALAILKQKYPDTKIIVTGNDMFSGMNGMHRYFQPGYMRYLYDLAKKLKILDSIHYVGSKNALEMTELFRTVHVAVIPSAIENAPNSLAEAMLIGTPCVASFVGGNMDMIDHNTEGFLYCYNEPNMLAEYISRIFDSDDLATSFSLSARNRALHDHAPEKLVNTLLGIYKDVIRRCEIE